MTQTKTAQKTRAVTYTKKPLSKRMRRAFLRDWQLLLLCLLPALYFLIFHYIPMYGVQLAFKDFRAADGIWGSQWAATLWKVAMRTLPRVSPSSPLTEASSSRWAQQTARMLGSSCWPSVVNLTPPRLRMSSGMPHSRSRSVMTRLTAGCV